MLNKRTMNNNSRRQHDQLDNWVRYGMSTVDYTRYTRIIHCKPCCNVYVFCGLAARPQDGPRRCRLDTHRALHFWSRPSTSETRSCCRRNSWGHPAETQIRRGDLSKADFCDSIHLLLRCQTSVCCKRKQFLTPFPPPLVMPLKAKRFGNKGHGVQVGERDILQTACENFKLTKFKNLAHLWTNQSTIGQSTCLFVWQLEMYDKNYNTVTLIKIWDQKVKGQCHRQLRRRHTDSRFTAEDNPVFTALHLCRAILAISKVSVRLSNAWIVTKRKKLLLKFLYHMKGQSS